MRRSAGAPGLLSRVRWPAAHNPHRVAFDGRGDGLERTGSVPDFYSVTCSFGFRPREFYGAPLERGRIYQAMDQVSSTGGYNPPFRVFYDHVTERLKVQVWNETAADADMLVAPNTSALRLGEYHYVVIEYVALGQLRYWIDGVLDGTYTSTYAGPVLGSLADESSIGTGQVLIVPRINHYHGDLDDFWLGYNQTPGIDAFWPRRNLGDTNGDVGYGVPELFFCGKAADWNAGRHRGTQTGWALTSEAGTGMEDAQP